jgi:hypothetical protein
MSTAVKVALLLCLAGSLPGRKEGWASHSRTELENLLRVNLEMDLQPIRAAIYLFYRRAGAGEIRITNRMSKSARGLTLEVSLPGREDLLPVPFRQEIPLLEPLKSTAVRVQPRFSPRILEEGTSELLFLAKVFAQDREVAAREALVPVLESTAVTWDVPERIAALIDPAPPREIVRQTVSTILPSSSDLHIRNFRLSAMAFDALEAWGFQYLEDSPDSLAQALLDVPVDRVNTPAETLRDHAGDCDDLSVLLASALEACGVPAGIGVSRDHVFVLFDLGIENLKSRALDPAGILLRGGHAWIPVEATWLTRRGATLLAAWNAARSRLQNLRSGATRFFEVRKAWGEFPTISSSREIAVPAIRPAVARSAPELGSWLRERTRRMADEARSGAGPEPGEADRSAAAVFARAGYRNEAEKLIRRAVAEHPAPCARIELAGVLLSDPRTPGDITEARRELQVALTELDPLDLEAIDQAEKYLEETSLFGEAAQAVGAAGADQPAPGEGEKTGLELTLLWKGKQAEGDL